jgi:hypothetical protein
VCHLHLFLDEVAETLKGGGHCHLPGFRSGRPYSHSPRLIVFSTAYAADPSGIEQDQELLIFVVEINNPTESD